MSTRMKTRQREDMCHTEKKTVEIPIYIYNKYLYRNYAPLPFSN